MPRKPAKSKTLAEIFAADEKRRSPWAAQRDSALRTGYGPIRIYVQPRPGHSQCMIVLEITHNDRPVEIFRQQHSTFMEDTIDHTIYPVEIQRLIEEKERGRR